MTGFYIEAWAEFRSCRLFLRTAQEFSRSNTWKTATKMFKIRSKGQNVVEYGFVVAIISTAAVAMTIYVYRSVQSKQSEMTKEFLAE